MRQLANKIRLSIDGDPVQTDNFISYIRNAGNVELNIVEPDDEQGSKSNSTGESNMTFIDIKMPVNDMQYVVEDIVKNKPDTEYAEELTPFLKTARRLNPREYIRGMLHKMGVPFHLSGTRFVETAFLLLIEEGYYIPGNLMNHIYPTVAKAHGTSKTHVERCMRYILDRSVAKGRGMAINNCLGVSMVRPNERLTIGEFLTTLMYCYQSDNGLISGA